VSQPVPHAPALALRTRPPVAADRRFEVRSMSYDEIFREWDDAHYEFLDAASAHVEFLQHGGSGKASDAEEADHVAYGKAYARLREAAHAVIDLSARYHVDSKPIRMVLDNPLARNRPDNDADYAVAEVKGRIEAAGEENSMTPETNKPSSWIDRFNKSKQRRNDGNRERFKIEDAVRAKRHAEWRLLILSTTFRNDATALRHIATAIRAVGTDEHLINNRPGRERHALELLIRSFAHGALSGPEWIAMRTMLADLPHFNNVIGWIKKNRLELYPVEGDRMTNGAPMLADRIEAEATRIDAAGPTPDVHRKTKRRRTASTKPLTELQKQALELYGEHNGRVGEIATAMNVTHSTVSQHLKAAWRKYPYLAPKKVSPVRTQSLPTDRRGQVNR